MKRIIEFDGIRGVAIMAIVACHICYGIEAYSPLGQYLGGTFNCVFFLISAMLLGLKYGKVQPYPKNLHNTDGQVVVNGTGGG